MFHHQTALNGAILEGATLVFNRYGGHTMSDFLDINWFVDKEWVSTFEDLLNRLKNGEAVKIWGRSTEYELTKNTHSFHIHHQNKAVATIPDYAENDLFLYLSTLLKGDYEY